MSKSEIESEAFGLLAIYYAAEIARDRTLMASTLERLQVLKELDED